MEDIYRHIGGKIRELRTAYKGRGMSQESLAAAVDTTANTVSRWETASYKPSVGDLERLSRFFGVPISVFFPDLTPGDRLQALLSATGNLDQEDLDELTRYAQYRRARKQVDGIRRKR